MTIRPATRHDIEACLRLWRLLQEEHESIDPRLRRSASAETRWRYDFRGWVRSDNHTVLVAELEGDVGGMVTAHPYWPAPVYEERLEFYVNELVVDPAWRGRGAGTALVHGIVEWARKQGVHQVRAGVLSGNPAALAFWQRVGASPFYTTVTIDVR